LRGSVGDIRQRSALRAHRPMSIPHTYGLRAMGRSEAPSLAGRPRG